MPPKQQATISRFLSLSIALAFTATVFSLMLRPDLAQASSYVLGFLLIVSSLWQYRTGNIVIPAAADYHVGTAPKAKLARIKLTAAYCLILGVIFMLYIGLHSLFRFAK